MAKRLMHLFVYTIISLFMFGMMIWGCDETSPDGQLSTPNVSTMPDFPSEESLGMDSMQMDEIESIIDEYTEVDVEAGEVSAFDIDFDAIQAMPEFKAVLKQAKQILLTGEVPDKDKLVQDIIAIQETVLTDDLVNSMVEMGVRIINEGMEPEQVKMLANFATDALIFLRNEEAGKQWVKAKIDEFKDNQYVVLVVGMMETNNPDFFNNMKDIIANMVYDMVRAMTDDGEPLLLQPLRETGTIDQATAKAGFLEMVDRMKNALPIMVDYIVQIVNEVPMEYRNMVADFINDDGTLNF